MNTVVTVIIPCYNQQDKVKRCIDSVRNQAFEDFSVYMIDDGSTDHTADVIKENIKDDNRFHYVYQPNGGLSNARNTGFKMTQTEFVCFVDSDDYIHQDYLKELITPLQNGDYDMSACYFERVYDDHTSMNTFSQRDLFLCKNPSAWAKMFRTETIRKNGVLFPEGLWYEDLCFFGQLVPHMKSIYVVKKPLYYYVQNPNSIMYTYSDRIYEIYKVFDLIGKSGSYDEKQLEYLNVYHILVGTVFRASFKEGFDKNELMNIVEHVEKQYPQWHRNPIIREQMSLFYRIYLFFIHIHWYGFVTLVLKLMNKHVSL